MPLQPGVEAAAQAMAQARVLADVEFGDADLVVTEHPDGLFTLALSEAQVVLNAEQMARVCSALAVVADVKGWDV